MEIVCALNNGAASDHLFLHQGIKKEVYMVGGEADEEDPSTHEDHPKSLLLLGFPFTGYTWVLQRYHCLPSAPGNGDNRNHKARQLSHYDHCH